MLRLTKAAEIRVEYLSRQFWNNEPPLPTEKCEGRFGAPDDLSDVSTNFKSF